MAFPKYGKYSHSIPLLEKALNYLVACILEIQVSNPTPCLV